MAPAKKHRHTQKRQNANQNHKSGSGINEVNEFNPTNTNNTSVGNISHANTDHHQATTVEHQQQGNEQGQRYITFDRSWGQDVNSYNHTAAVNDTASPMERWQNENAREQAWHMVEGVWVDKQRVGVNDIDELLVELEGNGDIGSLVCVASSGTRDA